MRPIDAYINNVSLRELDGRILVRAVNEQPSQSVLTYGDNPGRDGQRLLTRTRDTRRVVITFAVREIRDLAARASVVEMVNAWAQDGFLTVSYRPGRRLPVVVAGRATMQDPRSYQEDYSIQLDAPASPFWEDLTPQTLSIVGASGQGKLLNLGSYCAFPEITVTPTGGTLNTLTVSVGVDTFSFTGLGVVANTKLTIGHDVRGFLRIGTASAGKLQCRTAASSDELIAQPGYNDVSVLAGTACRVEISVRGRYL